MKRFVLGLVAYLMVAGCEAPQFKEFTLNTYQNEQPVAVNVKEISISSEVIHYDRLPHIEDEMIISPEQALKEWAQNRFYAVSSARADKMHIIIEQAYMTQTDEQSENWYTLDNVAYKLTYALKINFYQKDKVVYTQTVKGFESSSLPQKSSMADKEQVFENMMNQMIKKVNQQVFVQMPKEMMAF